MMRRAPLSALVLVALAACAPTTDSRAAEEVPAPKVDLHPTARGPQTMVVAMGCFWCSEGIFERIQGVTDVTSGYAGGTAISAQYETVSSGTTGHAESIRITYDPAKVSYGTLLRIFFTVHDPTTKDRQGPDYGHQYRSAIFYASDEEKAVAQAYVKQLDAAKVFGAPIATTLEHLDGFYPAEAYHQDFVRRHPDHPYVQMWFPHKLEKLDAHFKSLLKPGADKLVW